MKLDVKMVNLLGLLVIVLVLGLGTVGIVMPLYGNVESTSDQLFGVEQTNDTYRSQLSVLTEAEARKSEIEASVQELHRELPDSIQTDTALQAIADASASSGAFMEESNFSEPAAFTPRTAIEVDGTPADAPSTGDTAAAETATTPTVEGSGEAAAADDTAASEQANADPRQQVEVELVISVPDQGMGVAFLDALRSGDRSLLITSARLERGGSNPVTGWDGKLTVNLTIFFYQSGAAK